MLAKGAVVQALVTAGGWILAWPFWKAVCAKGIF